MTCYLVFGDLHGRVLPAFRLAAAWSREHGTRVEGLLQVGDLGYFPDPCRLDVATLRHALDDPLELGVQETTALMRSWPAASHRRGTSGSPPETTRTSRHWRVCTGTPTSTPPASPWTSTAAC